MADKTIQKRADPVALKLRNVRDGRDRSQVFCEGAKLVAELLDSDWRATAFYCTKDFLPQAKKLTQQYKIPATPITVLSDSVMEFCSDLTTPPGLIALAKPPKMDLPEKNGVSPLYLVLHGVQLPQNAGALLRTAEAAGVGAVYATPLTADLFGPKALRGSTGSAFRLPIKKSMPLEQVLSELKAKGIKAVAAVQGGKVSFDQFDWTVPSAIIVGSEGQGFTDAEIGQFDQTVSIPMHGRVESLNVGIAAAICLFEAARQRRAQ